MTAPTLEEIKNCIKSIPDYPIPGIMFRDITSLIENGAAFSATINLLVERYKDQNISKVVGTEARGFIFGAPLAAAIGAGFVPVRKPGKLPRTTVHENYELEYGTDSLHIHSDAIKKNERVLLVDDLLATGGTAEASIKLIHRSGGIVIESAFVIELPALKGAQKLHALNVPYFSLIKFEGE
ncbi:adenine phosphoribosyltransferase [Psychromonas ingrahamii 37]|uniref:Adenine phosphoribosyltransferase n=1 Tax=Psychromonas ingrahamii (strain DSM 17664 / CCUG 51855 / 37) TaxID=357804 RepID=APT_PSYIN|nr:adenine phosphoribosyltransferase [Psychromonas ingrahamii]A1SX04.1 RecName: Full=Adenine phosphoribosyltransferase; Short=APRT [Psychromonas ingrahamii 37]ABM04019.1 adenine phosphoribosyltransferase [Psychromonas ingrahamii 37]